jgi:hypothetical protein
MPERQDGGDSLDAFFDAIGLLAPPLERRQVQLSVAVVGGAVRVMLSTPFAELWHARGRLQFRQLGNVRRHVDWPGAARRREQHGGVLDGSFARAPPAPLPAQPVVPVASLPAVVPLGDDDGWADEALVLTPAFWRRSEPPELYLLRHAPRTYDRWWLLRHHRLVRWALGVFWWRVGYQRSRGAVDRLLYARRMWFGGSLSRSGSMRSGTGRPGGDQQRVSFWRAHGWLRPARSTWIGRRRAARRRAMLAEIRLETRRARGEAAGVRADMGEWLNHLALVEEQEG